MAESTTLILALATPVSIPVPSMLPPDTGVRNPFPEAIEPYFGAVFMETFLYGVYAVLFSICMYVLARRRVASPGRRRATTASPQRTQWGAPRHSVSTTLWLSLRRARAAAVQWQKWVLPAWAVAMFALASADIIYTYYIFFARLLRGRFDFAVLYPKYAIFVTNTVLADMLLLYRCYVVWGYRKRVVVGPGLLLVAATVCGYLFEGASIHLFGHSWVYLAMTFAFNIVVTGLTAGRIWYRARRVESLLGNGNCMQRRRYNTSVAILLESGAIYSVYMILDLAFYNHSTGNAILDAGLVQVVGIVPTLIIVQVGLGRAVNNTEDSDLEEASDLAGSKDSNPYQMSAGARASSRFSIVPRGGGNLNPSSTPRSSTSGTIKLAGFQGASLPHTRNSSVDSSRSRTATSIPAQAAVMSPRRPDSVALYFPESRRSSSEPMSPSCRSLLPISPLGMSPRRELPTALLPGDSGEEMNLVPLTPPGMSTSQVV